MADHPLVIDLLVPDLMSDASVRVLCASIRVFSDRGMLPKSLGKPFRTLAIDHARCIRSLKATRSVHHELFDQLKQVIIVEGELRRHEAINIFRSVQLDMRLKKDNDVGMRKATLLKLYSVDVTLRQVWRGFCS